MSNNVVCNPGSGGATINATDISTFTAYSTTGEVPGAIIYVSPDTTTAPAPLTNANPLPVSLQNASIAVTAASLPLPTGAATAANQSTANTSLASIDGKLAALGQHLAASSVSVVLASDQATIPVSLASSPLPTGAATSAKQDTGNTSLASIDGKITACNTGAVVVSSGNIVADTELTTADMDTGAGTDTRAVVGLVLAESGGGLLVGSAHPLPVSGTVTANQGGAPWSVGGSVASGATDSGNPVKVGGVYNSAAPTFTTGQRGDLQLDSAGRLIVNVGAGGASGGTSSSFGSAFPATGTAIGASDGTNMHALLVDASGFLKVNVAAGSSGNAAASATGSAVPVDADYGGINVAGTLRGQTGVNPTGTVYAAQVDLASLGGTALTTTLPVSGTVTANAGTGTFAVSAASLPLPTGAATAAKQPALGTAGTASADVITVQGIASMTALKVDGSGVTQPVSGTITANAGTGTFNNQQTNVTADYDTGAGTQNMTMFGIALPASGGSVAGGTATNPIQVSLANTAANATAVKVDGSGVTQPVSGTVTANAGTGNFTVAQATAASLNAQVQGAAASGASKAGNPVQVGGVFNTTQPTVTTGQAVELQATARGAAIVATGVDAFTVTVGAGSNTIGKVDQGAPAAALTNAWAVKVTDGATTMPTGASSATSIHTTVDNATLAVTQSGTFTVGNSAGTAVIGGVVPSAATGSAPVGATPFHLVSAATNNATNVKATPGTLFNIVALNLNTSAPRYVKLYDVSGTPNPATDAVKYVIPLPTAGSANGAGCAQNFPVGLKFTTGIAFAIVSGIGDTDNTSISANEVVLSGSYA